LRIAFANNKIETFSEEVVQRWIQLFEDYVAESEVTKKDTFTKKALEEVGINGKEKQAKFARAFNKYKTFSPELIDELKKDRFKVAEINNLQTTYELGGFTNADFRTCEVHQAKHSMSETQRTFACWLKKVKKNGLIW
jgi:isopentenyldiphosphate isomerase